MGLLGPLPRLAAASAAQVGLCFSFWGPSKNGRTTEGRPWAAPGLPRGQQVRATVPVSSPGSSVCSGRLRPLDSPCLAPRLPRHSRTTADSVRCTPGAPALGVGGGPGLPTSHLGGRRGKARRVRSGRAALDPRCAASGWGSSGKLLTSLGLGFPICKVGIATESASSRRAETK